MYVKVPNYQGICSVWDWMASKAKYTLRTEGLKYYCYKKVNGQQKTKMFDSFESAKAWRNSPLLWVEPSKNIDMTFEKVCLSFFEHKTSKLQVTTVDTYKSKAKHLSFFNEFPMSQINPHLIDIWLQQIKRPDYLKSQHQTRLSYRHELSVLRQVFVYYSEYLSDDFQIPLKRRHLDDSIVDQIRYKEAKNKNKVRFIPRKDYNKWLECLLGYSTNNPNLLVYAMLAQFQLGLGSRVGETCSIDWKDVDLENGTVLISKTVQWARGNKTGTRISSLTKSGEPRLVPLTNQLIKALTDWKIASGRSAGLVFSFDGFKPLGYRSVQYYYNRAFSDVGMRWTSTHILRHSMATDFLEKTSNQLALSKILGHKNLKQTEHYAKITSSVTEQGIETYNKSLEGDSVIDLKGFIQAKKATQAG